MLLSQKSKNTFLFFFSLVLIGYFVGIRAFFLLHQFSHHYNQNLQQALISKSDSKNIISKKTIQKPEENEDDCLICNLLHLHQNDILLIDIIALSLTLFALINLSIKSNNLNISPTFSLYQNRAPPLNC